MELKEKINLTQMKEAKQELVIMLQEDTPLEEIMTKLISVYGAESIKKTMETK
ncbi:MAG: hypothetical protein MJ181_01725 [Treponema sp.]|uniref:hypothetical protein n=1 Tax=Treponema sp. TaxID=166 RepID=UPI00298DF965|nr:hypothetical protein [Treponema sp.]MCQ2596541.1 hypothetical protein [Treponema sp.]MCQ2600908.1 hypothetical protein [Treponema sp.]